MKAKLKQKKFKIDDALSNSTVILIFVRFHQLLGNLFPSPADD